MFDCSGNKLTALDLSTNSSLEGSVAYLNCSDQSSSKDIDVSYNGTNWFFNFGTTVFADQTTAKVANVSNVACTDSSDATILVSYDQSTGELIFDTKPTENVIITYDYATGYTGETDNFKTMDVTLTCTLTFATTYNVTVKDGTVGGETSADYMEGNSVTITADDPQSGQAFKEWAGIVDESIITSGSTTDQTLTFTMPAYTVAVTAMFETEATPTATTPTATPVVYSAQVSGGNGVNEQTVIADGISTIIGTVQGDFEKFVDLYLEGQKLTEGVDYTAHEGSVVITLQPSYIKTLAYGTHTFTVQMTDGTTTFDVTVTEPSTVTYPDTGDTSNLLLSAILVLVGVGGWVGFLFLGKKTQKNKQ